MANTKISALPTWSGTAADLRFFVMNNSGNTETFKFSGYTSPYKQFSTDSIFSSSVSSTNTNVISLGINTTPNRNDVVAIGNSQSWSGPRIVAIGHNITNIADDSVIIGYNAIGCGAGGVTGVGRDSKACGNYGIALGYAAKQNYYVDRAITIGSNSTSTNTRNLLIGADCVNNGDYSILIGDAITLNAYRAVQIGGQSNTISSSGLYDSIINGSGNTIGSSYSGVSMLSCFGRTASASNTTYVENIHAYRTPSTQVQPISSGTTFTCNLENGAKSQFYITGTSTINITNVRDGASFMIKTQTDGNYVMTWTATGGYTFVFEGGIKDPGNNVTDIFVFEVFGSVIYGNRRHNYS